MEAITDRFLKAGPGFLFVVSLDSSPPPTWVPDKLIRFSLKNFGIEQLVGAIKARALEVGSAFHQPVIAAHATQAAEAIAFANERAALHRSTEGVQLSTAEVQRLFALIVENLQQATAAAPSLGIEFGATEEFLAARAGRGGVIAGYRLQWSNVLESAELTVREVDGYVMLPAEGSYYRHRPTERAKHIYQPDVSRASGWGWRSSSGQFITSEFLADSVARTLLAAIRRQAEESVLPVR